MTTNRSDMLRVSRLPLLLWGSVEFCRRSSRGHNPRCQKRSNSPLTTYLCLCAYVPALQFAICLWVLQLRGAFASFFAPNSRAAGSPAPPAAAAQQLDVQAPEVTPATVRGAFSSFFAPAGNGSPPAAPATLRPKPPEQSPVDTVSDFYACARFR